MSLFNAMCSGISSLRANSQSLSMIADNVANNQTHGYKGTHALFKSLVSQRSPLGYTAGGVACNPYRVINRVCPPQPSDVPTHMMIDGQGFFVAQNNYNPAAATQSTVVDRIYTRAGDFDFDNYGNLVNGQGHFIQGWALNSQGVAVKSDGVTLANKSILDDLSPIKINNLNGFSRPTTTLSLGANLPSDIAGLDAATQQISTLRVYDSLGAPHDLTLNWQKTDNAPLTWTVSITGGVGDIFRKNDVGGDIIGRPAAGGTAPITIVFNNDGTPRSFDGNPQPPSLFATWNGTSAAAQTISLNLGTVNKSDGITSKAGAFQNTHKSQDGAQMGHFTGVSISDMGIVNALFDSGQSLPVWQIPIVTFVNPNDLIAQTGTAYLPSASSGDPIMNTASQGNAGGIVPNALESSSVDLASEFANMIITQRSYGAASQIISTADEMFETLSRIKR